MLPSKMSHFCSRFSALVLLVFVLQLRSLGAGDNVGIPSYACSSSFASLPFCDAKLAVTDRVNDLVSSLSLTEKVQQLINSAAGVPRLGIPAYQWWSEALHGVSNFGPGTFFEAPVLGAVSFPQVILTAASFNVDLWKAIGQVVSTEARAMHNLGDSGLTFWSPNINIFRDPRWGRGQETPGEDPFLTSQYAVNYVQGLQEVEGGDSNDLKVAACCKHYTAYDLDNWNGIDRYHFDAQVTQQDMADTYQPPFRHCVEDGNAACVMCSYNRINGVPSCVDTAFLLNTVRNEWNLNGYIVSDCDSLDVLFNTLHYTQTPEDAAAQAILAGLNLNCGTFLANYTAQAVALGKLSEADVDRSLAYVYTVLMRLGYFNADPAAQRYSSLGASDVCAPMHRELAAEAARQGIVLLKNQANTLPLSRSAIKRLAVIGPNARATTTMIGNYAGIPCEYTSPLQGLAKYTQTIYEPGCSDVACSSDGLIEAAVQAALTADAVVLVVGLDQTQEAEMLDRTSLLLPGLQQTLITTVAEAATVPVVLVIMSGGPVDVTFAKESPKIPSMLWVGYPGEAGGEAIADVVFGDHNPAGKLPVTWYPESFTQVPMTDMRMRPSIGYPGRTYRFYTGETVYDFGYGLSYTQFAEKIVEAPAELALKLKRKEAHKGGGEVDLEAVSCGGGGDFRIRVEVENVGGVEGGHIVVLYVTSPGAAAEMGAPARRMVAFKRFSKIAAGDAGHVIFTLNQCKHLYNVRPNGTHVLKLGTHTLSLARPPSPSHNFSITLVSKIANHTNSPLPIHHKP